MTRVPRAARAARVGRVGRVGRIGRTAGLAVVLALALFACHRGARGAAGGGAAGPTPPAGAPPLDLTLPALDGGELALSELRGQIVVLHVFTTWSLAAQAEVDALRAADADADVTVVGLALDQEGYPLVAPWRKASEVGYLITLADDAIRAGRSPLGRLTTVPTTFVIDATGRVRDRLERPLAPGELAAAIDAVRADRADRAPGG